MSESNQSQSEWPECIRCDSPNTSVIPLTGEWSCEDCGCQWTYDELPKNDEKAEDIPNQIEFMLNTLAGETT